MGSQIEEYTPVDREFGKTAATIWDIAAAFHTKNIAALNHLLDDLYTHVHSRLRNSAKWGLGRDAWIDDSFPGKKARIRFTGLKPDFDIGGSTYLFPKRTRRIYPIAFCIDLMADRVEWSAGQYGDFGKEYFAKNFYDVIGRSLAIPRGSTVKVVVVHPNTESVDDIDKKRSYLKCSLMLNENIKRGMLIAIHSSFKASVVDQMLHRLQRM